MLITIQHMFLYRMCYYTACITIPHVLITIQHMFQYHMFYYTACDISVQGDTCENAARFLTLHCSGIQRGNYTKTKSALY